VTAFFAGLCWPILRWAMPWLLCVFGPVLGWMGLDVALGREDVEPIPCDIAAFEDRERGVQHVRVTGGVLYWPALLEHQRPPRSGRPGDPPRLKSWVVPLVTPEAAAEHERTGTIPGRSLYVYFSAARAREVFRSGPPTESIVPFEPVGSIRSAALHWGPLRAHLDATAVPAREVSVLSDGDPPLSRAAGRKILFGGCAAYVVGFFWLVFRRRRRRRERAKSLAEASRIAGERLERATSPSGAG
jgi:hypothetical protein